jgi:acetoacetyl-CoA reductase/3-oxoacyl-[acyl-carrier protein] reductase
MSDRKIALITGGTRGIGKGIAKSLAQKCSAVIITYEKNEELAEQTLKELIILNKNTKAYKMQIEDRSQVKSVLAEIEKSFSPINILVNNAAIAQEKLFFEITDSDWERMLKVNLQGPFICTQEILPKMIEQNWGRIVNISSVGGQWGGLNQIHYAASKAGLINFTRSMAKLFSKNGITTNAVAIGLAATDMSRDELESSTGKSKVENIPLGRISSVEEIADTVRFLVSEEASYITGQTINLNGGMYFG